MGSKRPSPAKVSSSSTLKLPPSSVRPVVLVSQRARCGRGRPACSFQMETFSAAMGDCTMGTRAERFFRMVTGSLSLYSKRSPSSCAEAADWAWARAASTLCEGGGGGGNPTARLAIPPLPPSAVPLPRERPPEARLADSVLRLGADAVTSTDSLTEPTLSTASCRVTWSREATTPANAVLRKPGD